jgi:ATP-dependent Clp protease adaptor protein ClpS
MSQDSDVRVIPDVTYITVNREDLEKLYRVIVENDDVTPMDFVVMVLRLFFGLSIEEALSVMLAAHNEGRALVTILPLEEAQERVYSAHTVARDEGYPLTFYLELDA